MNVVRGLIVLLLLAGAPFLRGDLNTALKTFSASLAQLTWEAGAPERAERERLERVRRAIQEEQERERKQREKEKQEWNRKRDEEVFSNLSKQIERAGPYVRQTGFSYSLSEKDMREQRNDPWFFDERVNRQWQRYWAEYEQKQQRQYAEQQRQYEEQQRRAQQQSQQQRSHRQSQQQQLPQEQELRVIEQKVHGFINLVRKAFKLSQLAWQPKLQQAAVNHSKDMAARKYFAHNSPEGHGFSYRYKQVGLRCMSGSENIYQSGPFTMSGWEQDQFGMRTWNRTVTDWGEFKDGILRVWQDEKLPNIDTMLAACGLKKSDINYQAFDVHDVLAFEAVHGWMISTKGHRENILTPRWRQEGIGVAFGSEGILKFTQNFC